MPMSAASPTVPPPKKYASYLGGDLPTGAVMTVMAGRSITQEAPKNIMNDLTLLKMTKN